MPYFSATPNPHPTLVLSLRTAPAEVAFVLSLRVLRSKAKQPLTSRHPLYTAPFEGVSWHMPSAIKGTDRQRLPCLANAMASQGQELRLLKRRQRLVQPPRRRIRQVDCLR